MILSQLTTLGKKSRLQSVHDESCIFRLKRYTLYATMRNYEGRNRTVPRRVSSPLGLVRIGGLFLRPYGRENPPDRFPDDCGRDARKH